MTKYYGVRYLECVDSKERVNKLISSKCVVCTAIPSIITHFTV